jgi:membrane fusion protein (multidrug efflux system)
MFLAVKETQKRLRHSSAKTQPYQFITVEQGPATVYEEFPARLQGKQNIEIRPKIDGFIEDIYIDEGAYVKQGQALFRIRNPQYEQQVRVAEAAIRSAQADVATAQMQVTKTKPLVIRNISNTNFRLLSWHYRQSRLTLPGTG